jgi:hypothetical protein
MGGRGQRGRFGPATFEGLRRAVPIPIQAPSIAVSVSCSQPPESLWLICGSLR